VLLVLKGRIRMKIGGEIFELGPRDVAHMPPN
jgi:mannose-6-phosphate isomerase-like protein (cupin superfamily)